MEKEKPQKMARRRMSEKVKALVAVMMIQSGFAGMFLLSKVTLDSGIKPAVFVVYRQALATLFFLPFAFFFRSTGSPPPPPLTWRALCEIFLVSSFGLALSFNLTFAGLKYVSATLGTAMLNTIPPAIFIMAVCLRAKVIGMLLGLCGAMAFTLYTGPPLYTSTSRKQNLSLHEKTYSRKQWIKGCLLCISAEIFFSLWMTMQGCLLQLYPGKLRLVALQSGFSCIAAAVYGAAVERNISSWKIRSDIALLSILYTGIVVAGASYWLQAWVIEKKGPVFCAVFGPLALIISVLLSAIFLKEILHWGSVLGSVLLIGGLYCFLWGRNRESPTQHSQPQLNSSDASIDLRTVVSTQHGQDC